MAYKKNETNISTRIKYLMKEKGLKSVELAEKVGITPVTVSYIINNKTIPSLEMLQKISDVLDVPVWQLLASPDEVSDAPVTSSPGGGIVWGERFYPCSTIEELRAAVEQLNGSDKGYK